MSAPLPGASAAAPEASHVRTPALLSPPDTHDPPTAATNKRRHDDSRNSEPVDASELSRALEQFKQADAPRQFTPNASPRRKRTRIYGDRFIPNRTGQDLHAAFSLLHEEGSPATPSRPVRRTPHNELHFQNTEEANKRYSAVLRQELFEDTIPQQDFPSSSERSASRRPGTPPARSTATLPPPSKTPATPHKNLFRFSSQPTPMVTPRTLRGPNMNALSETYSLTPVRFNSQALLTTPRKQPRHVAKVPYKVLDAPELADDFYLNLVDWGNQGNLGVGLGQCVYMWNANNGAVTKLLELPDDTVTSVNWMQRGSHIAIGTNRGHVQIWDANAQRRLRTMTGHTNRVGALAWNDHILTSGSRDRSILHRDVRQPQQFLCKLLGHRQEVCGLKWNQADGQLASGGNDNKLMVWEKLNSVPTYKWTEHSAAVKAIDWSPHERGLLASGGGTADRTIKFWNTLLSPHGPASAAAAAASYSNTPAAPPNLVRSVDTGSQVCNLAWSRNSNELVSTHGYSQNQIIVWKYPNMRQVASLTGHTFRVLYLAMSPDGQVIVTGAGDETLRFWNTFKRKDVVCTFREMESSTTIR